MTSVHEALIQLMTVAALADAEITQPEMTRIEELVGRSPVFQGFDRAAVAPIVYDSATRLNTEDGIELVIDAAIAALPPKLQDTAYALAVEITALDLRLEQEELRFLEMMRDRMALDRLTTAAIEASARARYRRMPG